MSQTVEIRPLARSDDRSHFSCGESALDRFFQHYAGQNQFRLGLATTYVAVAGGRILGFSTVTMGSLQRAQLPDLPLRRRLPSYPLPVLRLARLGVDTRAQGRGIGRLLLRHVLLLAVRQRELTGCIGVVTDAKAEAVGFYASLGFVAFHGVRQGRLSDEPLPMFLGMKTIEQAL